MTSVASVSINNLKDFNLQFKDGEWDIVAGSVFPMQAQKYLESILNQTLHYKSIKTQSYSKRFSLYQPALDSLPGKRMLYYRLLRKFLGHKSPVSATLGITPHCQCDCQHCSADYHMKNKSIMDNSQWLGAISETIELGVSNVIFLGGEPLLRKDIETMIRSVDPDQSIATMFTNGELLSKKKCVSLKDAGLEGIFVSLDSHLSDEHNKMRGRAGLFAKALNGIENALACQIPVAISSWLDDHKIQAGYLDAMMELGQKLGVHEVTFFDAIPVGKMDNKCHTFLDDSSREIIFQRAAFYRKTANYPIISPQSTLTSKKGSAFCFAGTTQFYLSSSGAFCPCDFTPLSIGNYPQQSISQLWEELTSSKLYRKRSRVCRMQDPKFREMTIHKIPDNAPLPYPIQKLSML